MELWRDGAIWRWDESEMLVGVCLDLYKYHVVDIIV